MSQKPRKKGGRAALARRAPRLLGRHDGWPGRQYASAYAAAEEEFGPFTSRLVRMAAGRMAAAWVRFVGAQRALETARRERERGKGRRPSVQAVERLHRRAGLEDTTYSQALDKLRELAGPRKERDLSEYLREKYGMTDGHAAHASAAAAREAHQ